MDTLNHLITSSSWFTASPLGYLLLFTVLAIGTGIGLPRQIAALSAGMLFGIKIGFAIATLATITGCILTFTVSRYLLADLVFKRFPDKSTLIHDFLSESTFVKALIIRILPLGSNFVTNVIAGATRIPFTPYVAGSALGFIPQMVVFTLAGGGIKLASEQQSQLTVFLVLIACLLGLFLWLTKRQQKSKGQT